jgi:hypothetical protein
MTKKKNIPKKKRSTPRKINLTPDEPDFGDLTKMSMQGAVFTGSLGLMSTMGGMMNNK